MRRSLVYNPCPVRSPAAAVRQPTDDLQCPKTRTLINSIVRDMDALGPSCSAETAVGFCQPGCLRSANSQATTDPGHSVSRGASKAKTHCTPRLRCPVAAPLHKQKFKDREKDRKHHRHHRRRWARRTACSETVEDASSTLSHVRSLRVGCVVNVERKSIPQPLIEKCPRVLPLLVLPFLSLCPSPPTWKCFQNCHVSSSARPFKRKHGPLTLLDPRARRDQIGHNQVDTRAGRGARLRRACFLH